MTSPSDGGSEVRRRLKVPGRSRVVVVGGGVIGSSVAFHLASLGESDVLLVEKDSVSSGSTWHAAGLAGAIRSSDSLTRIAARSRELYRAMESQQDQQCGYVECGGLWVARTDSRLGALGASAKVANRAGVEVSILDDREAHKLWPLLDRDLVVGAVWAPDEGRINAADLSQAFTRMARQLGVSVHEHTAVTGLKRASDGRIRGIETDAGDVECEIVVNAAGQWAPNLGEMVGVPIPIHPVSNTYVVTGPHQDIPRNLPNLRDPDVGTYYKSETGALVFGGLSAETAQPWVNPSDIPVDFAYKLLPENWDEMLPLLEAGSEMTPVLREVGLQKLYNGPEAFTPDHRPILGWSRGVPGLFTVAGLNGSGIGLAGGIGEVAAATILGQDPGIDLSEFDAERFGRMPRSHSWVRKAVEESVLRHFEMQSPVSADFLH